MGRILSAVALTAVSLPIPSAFADQVYSFQLADYPASQNGYTVNGIIEFDVTTNDANSASFSLTPPDGPQLYVPNAGTAVTSTPMSWAVNGNTVDLLLTEGSIFSLIGATDPTHGAAIDWANEPPNSIYSAGSGAAAVVYRRQPF